MAGARRRLAQAVRVTWLLAALGFITWLIASRWEEATGHLAGLALWQPVAALILLIVGKFIYIEAVRRSLKAAGVEGGWPLAFSAYNLSQLGKYIPGSVWQFVGRFGIYRMRGMSAANAMGLILAENLVMLAMAGLVGLIAAPVLLELALDYAPLPVLIALPVLLSGLGIAVALLVPPVRERLNRALSAAGRHTGLIAAMAVLFVLMWFVMGLSAFCLVADRGEPDIGLAFYVIGLFAVSYVAGFVAIFAPAGVGVREAVFTIGLAGIMPAEAALLLAVGHRLLYVLCDFGLGLIAWGVHARMRAQEVSG